jgi:dTDP-4-dehydrorhamnose reductase
MKNILITGANGQLGLKIKDVVMYENYKNFILTDINDLDITDNTAVKNFIRNNDIGLIINCAAYTAVDFAEEESDKVFLLNSYAPENLAKLSKKYNLKLIHISTDYVFDGNSYLPYSEDNIVNPISVYGKSKLDGENRVLKQDAESIIVRTSWLYSEYGKNFAKTILKLADEKETINVVYDQIGTPTYAGDLAQVLINISNKYFYNSEWFSGIYHYSNLGVCSWFDFAVMLLKLTGKKTKIQPVLSNEFITKAKRPHYSVLDKSKITNTYNVDITYWLDACEKMLENYKKLN